MFYIVYGIGNDAVGLVGQITIPIAEVRGNIVDMRQDVLHGLFTIYLVVDLKEATVSIDEFERVLKRISEQTGLRLSLEKYTPVLAGGEKKNMLVTLVGKDKPGIIAAITEKLGRYNINIETSEMVAREAIFVMDLLLDVSGSSIPTENLKTTVREIMHSIKINTMFQTEDVFNKKIKIVMFDITGSFVDAATLQELMAQASVSAQDLTRGQSQEDLGYVHATAQYLENLPLDVITAIVDSIEISRGTTELLQSLKIMGYKIGLISTGFSFFTTPIRDRLNLDYAFGYELPVDDDSKTIIGDLPAGLLKPLDRSAVVKEVMQAEGVDQEDITIISDRERDYPQSPGIRLHFNMKVILDFMNQRVLSRDALTGLLRSFGVPKL